MWPPPTSGSAGANRASDAKRLKKSSSGPNTTDGRSTVADGTAAPHQRLADALGAGIGGDRVLVGADRRHMHHPRAVGRRRQRHRFGAARLDRIETLASALEQDADQVDHHVGAARRRIDRTGVAQIGLHRVDLADPAERLQVAGEVRPPYRDADPVAALAERADHVPAEEAGAAIDRDQRVDIGLGDIGLDFHARVAR